MHWKMSAERCQRLDIMYALLMADLRCLVDAVGLRALYVGYFVVVGKHRSRLYEGRRWWTSVVMFREDVRNVVDKAKAVCHRCIHMPRALSAECVNTAASMCYIALIFADMCVREAPVIGRVNCGTHLQRPLLPNLWEYAREALDKSQGRFNAREDVFNDILHSDTIQQFSYRFRVAAPQQTFLVLRRGQD